MRTDDEGPRYSEDELRLMKYWSDRSWAEGSHDPESDEAVIEAGKRDQEAGYADGLAAMDEFGDAEHAEFVQSQQY